MTKKIRIFVMILMFILSMSVMVLLASISGRVDNEKEHISDNIADINLELTVGLEKTTFKKGEEINFSVILKNNDTRKVFIQGIYVNTDIYFPEGSVTDSISLQLTHGYAVNKLLEHGESITEKIRWDQKYFISSKEYYAKPGTYRVDIYARPKISDRKNSDTYVDPYLKTESVTIIIE